MTRATRNLCRQTILVIAVLVVLLLIITTWHSVVGTTLHRKYNGPNDVPIYGECIEKVLPGFHGEVHLFDSGRERISCWITGECPEETLFGLMTIDGVTYASNPLGDSLCDDWQIFSREPCPFAAENSQVYGFVKCNDCQVGVWITFKKDGKVLAKFNFPRKLLCSK